MQHSISLPISPREEWVRAGRVGGMWVWVGGACLSTKQPCSHPGGLGGCRCSAAFCEGKVGGSDWRSLQDALRRRALASSHSPQARDRRNHCVFPSLGMLSTPLLAGSPACIIDGHFRSVCLLPRHTRELRGAVHSLVLALYHTQSRCSIMNECICSRINTHSPVFAGAHTQSF